MVTVMQGDAIIRHVPKENISYNLSHSSLDGKYILQHSHAHEYNKYTVDCTDL